MGKNGHNQASEPSVIADPGLKVNLRAGDTQYLISSQLLPPTKLLRDCHLFEFVSFREEEQRAIQMLSIQFRAASLWITLPYIYATSFFFCRSFPVNASYKVVIPPREFFSFFPSHLIKNSTQAAYQGTGSGFCGKDKVKTLNK